MATQWLRLWHDMPNDPKWRTISKISKQPITSVISVYVHLLVSASSNTVKRGVTQCNAEDVASALDLDTECVTDIIIAMQGRVLEGDDLTGWDMRQPAREDDSSERVRAYRERKKSETQCNADVTQCNAPDKDTDKDKKERKEVSNDTSKRKSPIMITPDGFEEFRLHFPKQRAGSWEKAKIAFIKALQRANLNEILDGVKSYRSSDEVMRGFAKGAAAWLNDDRWTHDYSTTTQQQQNLSFTQQREATNRRILDEGLKRYEENEESEPG